MYNHVRTLLLGQAGQNYGYLAEEAVPAEFVPVAVRIDQRKRDLEQIETLKTRETA